MIDQCLVVGGWKARKPESWKARMLERWKAGMLERWNAKIDKAACRVA